MRATFSGLEAAKRAIFVQQTALYTTGHNIANANTPGFSRQRVDFKASDAFPNAAFNRPEMPGQIGSGVESGAIQRYRDNFLDMQFRQQHAQLGYWNSQASGLARMEEVMNELGDEGLSKVMNQFWSSLEDLSVYPEDTGARKVVLQRGQALAETFAYMDNRLQINKRDIGVQIDNAAFDVNSIVRQISDLNKQIGETEPNGYLPNDLYDRRDQLIDELSQHMAIKVSYSSSGGNSSSAAQGKATIEILNENRQPIGFLVDGKVDTYNQIRVNMDAERSHVQSLTLINHSKGTPLSEKKLNMNTFTSGGSFLGHIHQFGYELQTAGGGTEVTGVYEDMIEDLNLMAESFATRFNEVHREGWNMEQIRKEPGAVSGLDFFTFTPGNAAASMKLNAQIDGFPDRIAAAQPTTVNGVETAFSGNGANALRLGRVKDDTITIGSQQTSVATYYQGMIGNLGVMASEANRLGANNMILTDSIQRNRDSVSTVSLDEEMTNMIKYQQAFNAASRTINAVDEMLDKIINGMGLVGR